MRTFFIALTSSIALAALLIVFCSNFQKNRNSLRKEDLRIPFSSPSVLNGNNTDNNYNFDSQELRLLRDGDIDIDQLLEVFSREYPEYVNKTPDYFETESLSPSPGSSLVATIQPSPSPQDQNETLLATVAPALPVVSTLTPTTLPPQSTVPPTTLAPQSTFIPTTLFPQTVVPTTLIPQTLAPTTLTPLSIIPTTVTPQTMLPTTLTPQITLPPTTLTPQSLIPTTVIPQTLPPTTLLPLTLVPTTIAPTTLAPIVSRRGKERHQMESSV
jgi:hypothetical protein